MKNSVKALFVVGLIAGTAVTPVNAIEINLGWLGTFSTGAKPDPLTGKSTGAKPDPAKSRSTGAKPDPQGS